VSISVFLRSAVTAPVLPNHRLNKGTAGAM
jgi:hypothetical protein